MKCAGHTRRPDCPNYYAEERHSCCAACWQERLADGEADKDRYEGELLFQYNRAFLALLHLVAASFVESTALPGPNQYESLFDYEVELVEGYAACLGMRGEAFWDDSDWYEYAREREVRKGRRS